MKRRKFLLASGSTILTGTTVGSLQRPALGLEFELSALPDEKPTNIHSILIEFTNFEITPSYLDESTGLDITVELDIEGESLVTKSVSGVGFTNGQTVDQAEIQNKTGKDLSQVFIDGLDKQGSNLQGDIYVRVNHSDISIETYQQSFEINQKNITEDFENGSLNTSKWSFIDASSGASYTESSSRIKLNGSNSRPYLRTASELIDGVNGGSINLKSRSKINTDGTFGQLQMYGWWDGNYQGEYDTPINAVGFYVDDNNFNGQIRIIEGGSRRVPVSTSVSGLNSYSDWELDLSGDFSNFTATVRKDNSQILSKSGLTFSPTNNSPYAAAVAREIESTTSFDTLNIII